MELNYYSMLGLPLFCDDQEKIRAAYMAQARFFHPDANHVPPDIGTEKMKALNEIYAVLRSPERKRAYDASLGMQFENASSKQQSSSGGNRDASNRHNERSNAQSGAKPRKPSDNSTDYNVSFEEAVRLSKRQYSRKRAPTWIDILGKVSVLNIPAFVLAVVLVAYLGEYVGIDMDGEGPVLYVLGCWAVTCIVLPLIWRFMDIGQSEKYERLDVEAYAGDVVYASEHGTVYHSPTCRYSMGSDMYPILLRYVGNRTPCKFCNPPRRQ